MIVSVNVESVLSMQIGVDVLGFPVYKDFYFGTFIEEEIKHTQSGKNMKNLKKIYNCVRFVRSFISKQF